MGNRRPIEVHPTDGEIRRTDILAEDDPSDEFDKEIMRFLWRFLAIVSIMLVIAVTPGRCCHEGRVEYDRESS